MVLGSQPTLIKFVSDIKDKKLVDSWFCNGMQIDAWIRHK
jgi:hypothetical protein